MSIFVYLCTIFSVFRHIIYAIFFWQLINKTADCFNNIVFISVANISSKKVCEKMENNSALEKVLLVCNRNAEPKKKGATFNSKVTSLRRLRKKNLIILKSFHKKSLPFFGLFICRCWHLSCQIAMLTARTSESAAFKICLNIITICIFIEQ